MKIWGRLWSWLRLIARSDAFQWSLLCVVVWRMWLELVNQLGPLVKPFKPARDMVLDLGNWMRWDGGWYLDVIQSGYRHIETVHGQENFAFFPSFPMMVKTVSSVLHVDPVLVGLVLNTLLTIVVCMFLYGIALLVVQDISKRTKRRLPATHIARLSVVLLLVYPASLFFAALYAEAVLILGITGAFYYVLRGKLYWATPFLILATATKSMGFAALPALALITFEAWQRSKEPLAGLIRRWFPLGLGVLGLVGYMCYLWYRFGDPLLFYKVQKGWGRNDGNFFLVNVVERYYVHIFDPAYFGTKYSYVLNLIILALPFLVLGFGVWAGLRLKLWWPLALGFFVLFLPLSTGVMESLNRYVMAAAPAIPVAISLLFLARLRWLVYAALAVLFCLLLPITLGFLHGSYFAG